MRIDPSGLVGPTERQAAGRAWRRTTHGHYVPAQVDDDVVEQRILEQAQRVTRWGAVSGWASLRWRGAAYFTGLDRHGRRQPVPVTVGFGQIRPHAGIALSQEQLAPSEREPVEGVWCTTPARAVFDEIRGTLAPRSAVVAADMAIAAGLLTHGDLMSYVGHRQAWTGVPFARRVVALATDGVRSPQENWMRLCWVLDAELPTPLCNRPVYDRAGAFLGTPDLLDPVAGVVGEYDGAYHRTAEQHRRDVEREARFRDHGLEYFTVVEGELPDRWAIAQRMRSVRDRASFTVPDRRRWTVQPPSAA